MATSLTDAAFEGFRVAWKRPLTLVGWGIFSILASLVLGGVMLLTVGPMMLARFAEISSGVSPTPAPDLFSGLGMFAVALPIMVIGALVITAVQTAAIYRSVLRPGERGWAYLRLGGDELRLLVLTLAMFLIGLATFGLAVFVLVLAVGAVGEAGGVLLAGVGGLALFCAWVYVVVRLSLAAAITFAERRVSLFDSWGLTQGRFWPLLGMYLLVLVLSIVVSLAGSAFAQVFASMGLIQSFQAWAMNPQVAPDLAAAGVSMPMLVVSLVGYFIALMISNVIQLAVLYAPQAAAYGFLAGPPPETTSEVFR